MSAITDLGNRIGQGFSGAFAGIKLKIFGPNNERLDFVMDSFYKLSPQQRNGVVAGLIGVIFVFVVAAIFVYFAQISSLEKEMTDSFAAIQVLKSKKIDDQIEQQKFEKLAGMVKKSTAGINFKPFFEKLSKEGNVSLRGLTERSVDIDSSNPLSEKLKEVHVEMKMPKISIPRLLDFLVDIEKSGHYLRVQDLKITGLYGNKLFFDVTLVVRGYTPI